MPQAENSRFRPSAWERMRKAALRFGVALAALAAGGAALDLGNARVREVELEAGLRREVPDIDRTDALSQHLAVFMLGGLRSLAAGILALDATDAWLVADWPRAERRWETVTTLAPNRVNYWAGASRDMAVNAESHTRRNPALDRVAQAQLSKRYYERGVRFLEDGIANNPRSALLYCHLGDVLSDLYRRPDFTKAAAAYHKANELGAPQQYARLEFYNLCRVRGREKEAYELGSKLFQNPANHVPSVLNLLFVLQNRLDLPEAERLSVEDLYGSVEEARDYMKSFPNNDLRFPTDGVARFLESTEAR